MLNIDTTYFPSDSIHWKAPLSNRDTVCPVEPQETAQIIICPPLEKHYFQETALQKNQNVIGSLIFTIVFLVIFAFVRLRGKDLFANLVSILIKRKKVEIILNEGISSNLVCYILSLFLSFSVIATGVVYLAMGNFDALPILLISSGLVVYHFFLLGLVKLLGWTFNSRYTAAETVVNIWTYHIMSGLLISPFVIAIFFVKSFAISPLLNVVIFGLIAFQLLKIVRWIEILFAHRVLILYMILYLCALEVMPLLVLYKLAA